MAALANDIYVETVGPVTMLQFPAIADTFFQGGLVFNLSAGGNVTNLPVDTGDNQCVGICLKQQVIATAGDLLEVAVKGLFWLPIATTAVAADALALLYVDDTGANLTDNPVDLINSVDTALAAQDIVVGRLIRVTSSRMLVAMDIAGVTGANVVATGAAVVT